MTQWDNRRILVLGTTYPSYSRNYTETVCVGGIDGATGELVRIHPVPHRYLEPEHQFRAFQWIRVRATKNVADPRPESLRVEPRSIIPEEVIPSSDPDARRAIIEGSPHLFGSVEELRTRNKLDGTSLGIVKPRSIGVPQVTNRSAADREEWKTTERTVLSQTDIWGALKPLDYPEWRFMVPWTCDHADCKGHTMHLNEWGIHELARKYKTDPDGREKVLQAMQKRLSPRMDVYFFLGNYRTKLYNFGLMGSYSAPVQEQGSLF